jgi:hypothetical protein
LSPESLDKTTFMEYTPLGPKRRTREHYLVLVGHIVAAFTISLIQLSIGLSVWFLGFGILTPILLILQGLFYSFLENDTWYREEMVPFISRLITTTESETDRLRQYHLRLARSVIVLGCFDIILCQLVWTYGLTVILPSFLGDDLLIRFIGELLAIVVVFGPFFLYLIVMLPIASTVERIYKSRYSDIAHLLDIENKWSREDNRRAKEKKAMLKGDASSDTESITNRNE